MMKHNLSPRFREENLGLHWIVDETKESFKRLKAHLEINTNFRKYFDEAINRIVLPENAIVVDIGAGVGWTSAILASNKHVDKVYVVEPSKHRLNKVEFVVDHFDSPQEKIVKTDGAFQDIKIKEKVDLVVMTGSFHHCWDKDLHPLFRNIKNILKSSPEKGRGLIANEHYVTPFWTFKQMLSWMKHFADRSQLYYGPGKWRTPHPFDGEHWRTRREIEQIFQQFGFTHNIYLHDGDLCKDKANLYRKIGWKYYHAVLSFLSKGVDFLRVRWQM